MGRRLSHWFGNSSQWAVRLKYSLTVLLNESGVALRFNFDSNWLKSVFNFDL